MGDRFKLVTRSFTNFVSVLRSRKLVTGCLLGLIFTLVVALIFWQPLYCLLEYRVSEATAALIIALVGAAAAVFAQLLPSEVKKTLISVLGGTILALVSCILAAVFVPPPPQEECFPTATVTPTPTPMSTPIAIPPSVRTETLATTKHNRPPPSCPCKFLVLIRPFEGNGDLNVERSILEAFERAIRLDTDLGQIDVQIGDHTDISKADHVFVVQGWYDSAAVHAEIFHRDERNRFYQLECCPPGEAKTVPFGVVIEVCYQMASVWRAKGCTNAALELLLQLKIRTELDRAWAEALSEFLRKG